MIPVMVELYYPATSLAVSSLMMIEYAYYVAASRIISVTSVIL